LPHHKKQDLLKIRKSLNKVSNIKQTNEVSLIEIYADGACKGNPGPGGWGALLKCGSNEKELFGGESITTNNRMELTAVIRALEAIKRPCKINVYTDSSYVQKGITEWIVGWKSRNWRTADKKPVKNEDLWRSLDQLVQTHTIDWIWVKGHAGNAGNERADMLANRGALKYLDQ
jgi:ribonuclease HI